jgi:regulator of RNase E activity RraA
VPGDILAGDADRLAVVPPSDTEDVAAKARKPDADEQRLLSITEARPRDRSGLAKDPKNQRLRDRSLSAGGQKADSNELF